MLTEQVAREIKAECGKLSALEQAGIFAGLTEQEQGIVDFLNRLDYTQTTHLILSLDGLEHILANDGLLLELPMQRDIDNLAEVGIDVRNDQRMAFVYGLLRERLNGGEHSNQGKDGFKKMAQIKALSRSLTQVPPAPLEPTRLVDQGLQGYVDAEVRKVERYLGSYLAAVQPLLLEFLPLHIGGGASEAEIHIIDDYGWKDDPASSSPGRRRYSDRIFLTSKGLKLNHPPFSQEGICVTESEILELACPVIHFRTESHTSLEKALFGMTLPSPVSVETEVVIRQTDGSFEIPRRSFSIDARHQRHAVKLAKRLFPESTGHLSGEKIMHVIQYNGDRDDLTRWISHLFYSVSVQSEITYRKRDDGTIDFTHRQPVGITADWNAIRRQAEPLFVFLDFSPSQYSLRTYQSFWAALQAYAQLPAELTSRMTAAFRDNYLHRPTVDIQRSLEQVQQGLRDLEQTLNQVRSQGYLAEAPTAKLLAEEKS